jgi:HEAT repeat protein
MVQQLKVDDSVAVRIQLARAAAALKLVDSIPSLIENLRDRDPDLVRECRLTLQTLSREDHGDDYTGWALWWENARRS